FTRADARAFGWSDSALSRAVRSGRVTKVRHGHFSTTGGADPILRAHAALAACRGSVISHRSAALVHDLPLLDPAPARPDLTVPPGRTGDVTSALLHRAGLPPEDVVVIGDAAVTSVARTVVDLARTLPLDSALVPMDAALHRRFVDRAALEAVLTRCAIWPNARRAARVIALADGRSESPLETVSRLVIPRLGLPIPQPQGVVRNRFGLVIGRCDFYWDEPGVFGEADGRSKYDGRDILTAEKDRQEALERLGLVSVRWGWSTVRVRPRGLATRVLDAFERGRLRDRSGFPRKWSVDPPVTG
ncbi:MAG: hypothetical protein QOD07_1440, partial [Frankiaceae bacterium]|nr:hypothetical protein [Frankiaceae bacterium]